jgi:hypothetical protein
MVNDIPAAHGPGAMGRAEDHPVSRREDLLGDTVMDLLCHLLFTVVTEKIGPHDIPGKDGVPTEYPVRGCPAFYVTDNKGDAFQDIPGGLKHLHGKGPEREGVALVHVVPLRNIPCSALEDISTAPLRKRERPDYAVIVPVGFKNMRDGAVVQGRNLTVNVPVSPGIDDCSLSCIPGNMRVMLKNFRKYPFKQHITYPGREYIAVS